MSTHVEAVHSQFDPQAQAYLTSTVHAQGPDLLAAGDYVAQQLGRDAVALDLGCGAGHLGFVLAPRVGRLVAADASAGMLETVAAEARRRGLGNLQTSLALAESLPFADASFDLVATRYSAHHWRDVPAALREARRVLKPAGRLIVIDVVGPADPLVDTHFQALELLRDTSHVRDYSHREWLAMLAQAGFVPELQQEWPVRLDFASWVERMRTPMLNVQMLRALQAGAPLEVQQALAYEDDGSFTMCTGLYGCRVAG